MAAESQAGTLYRAAEHELIQALTWHPENAQAYRALAEVYSREGDRPATVAALAGYSTLQPQNPLGYWELGLACEQLAAVDLARIPGQPCGTDEKNRQATLARIWQKAGQSAASFVEAGDKESDSKNWDQAESFYHRALVLDSQFAGAWYGLGRVHQAHGELDQAMEAYDRVLALNSIVSLQAQAYDSRGQVMASMQRWGDASAELARAVALAPDNGQYHLDYGWYLFKAGQDYQKAYAELTKAVSALPANPIPHLRLADLEFSKGNYDEMLSHARQAADIQPTLFWCWVSVGRALSYKGQLVDAQDALQRAIELAPDQAVSHEELGHALMQRGNSAEAIAEYEKAVALAADNVIYRLNLGNAYRSVGRWDAATETYRHVLDLDPGNTAAMQALHDLENQED
jgi:superkiller protein 3